MSLILPYLKKSLIISHCHRSELYDFMALIKPVLEGIFLRILEMVYLWLFCWKERIFEELPKKFSRVTLYL